MNIVYYDVTGELEKDPCFLHDRDKWRAWLTATSKRFKYVDLVVRYRYYDGDMLHGYCRDCDADLEDDWEYCPYCGTEIGDDLELIGDDISDIKRQYSNYTGEPMPDDEIDKIKARFVLKVWCDL